MVEIAYLVVILHLIDIIVLEVYRYRISSSPIIPQELIIFEINSMESTLLTASAFWKDSVAWMLTTAMKVNHSERLWHG
ncbi:hypothetical protein V5J35_002787 [Endozoicomonas sp. NE40]|uniref:Secreted protein n=1 Tax=Endozoicomonas lisbonensis TaxID=3120522 RepID=A0ABV2SIK1_9GAMM